MIGALAGRISRLGLGRGYSPIAVEFDGRSVRAAQARLERGVPVLHAVAEYDIEGDFDPLSRAVGLERVLRRKGFAGRKVALCAPNSMLDSDLVDLSDCSSADPTEHVRTLLSRATGVSGTHLDLAYWVRRQTSGPASAYAVALRHAHAHTLLDPMRRAGLELVSISCAAVATGELLHRLGLRTGCSALLRVAGESSQLLLNDGRRVIYQRHLDCGGVANVAAHRLEALATEAAGEFRQTLECVPRTFGNLTIERLLITGPGLRHGGLRRRLNELLPSPKVLSPEVLGGVVKADVGFDVAVGIALAELEGPWEPEVSP
jgi:hypothetical protein